MPSHPAAQPAHRNSEDRSLPVQLDHSQHTRRPFVKPGGRPGIVLERLAKPMSHAVDGDGLGQRLIPQRLEPAGTRFDRRTRGRIDSKRYHPATCRSARGNEAMS